MEIQLQELIAQIKADGVAVAESEAASRLEAANAEAERIISDAKAEAEKILSKAKEENDRLVRVSEDAIRQAGRNLLISFRESVGKELDAIIGAEVAKGYDPETVAALIPKVVQSWSEHTDAEDIAILLNSADLVAVEKNLLAALKEKMLSGVTLKPDESFKGGFRIAVNNGSAYYDYSTEAVTEMFSAYLNPRVAALMKGADQV